MSRHVHENRYPARATDRHHPFQNLSRHPPAPRRVPNSEFLANRVIACRTAGSDLERDRRRYRRLPSKIYLLSNVAPLVAEIENYAS